MIVLDGIALIVGIFGAMERSAQCPVFPMLMVDTTEASRGNSTATLGGIPHMRALEIIVGLIVAAVLFVVLKIIGIVIKFAIIAAVIGFIVGAAVTMMFRSKSS